MKPLFQGLGRSFLLIALILSGIACGGNSPPTNNNNNNPNTPTPVNTPKPVNTPDPTLAAQLDFNNNVWPFFQNNRCEYCHNFEVERTTFMPSTGHPTSGCTGCHSPAILGTAFNTSPWMKAPDTTPDDRWTKLSDPFAVRTHILLKGPLLYNHLVGSGANQTPLVQWAFFNGPDVPPNGLQNINAGRVPVVGGSGQEFPSGQIPNSDLIDFTKFKPAIDQWLTLECKAGNTNLGFTCPP